MVTDDYALITRRQRIFFANLDRAGSQKDKAFVTYTGTRGQQKNL